MAEIVYLFTNPAMPDLIKIGKTYREDVQQRLYELYNHTGVPQQFECAYQTAVGDAGMVEKALHTAFEGDRVNPKREFFKTPVHRAIALLKAFSLDAKYGDEDSTSESSGRRVAFTFSAADVPVGAILEYSCDPSRLCIVVDDKRVDYEGEEFTLSGLAMKFRTEDGYKNISVAGPSYFTYEGETLTERRIRIEETKCDCSVAVPLEEGNEVPIETES